MCEYVAPPIVRERQTIYKRIRKKEMTDFLIQSCLKYEGSFVVDFFVLFLKYLRE